VRARLVGVAAAMASALVLASTVTPARGEEALPPVGDIVARTRAVMERRPENVSCRVQIETKLFDKAGKLEHEEMREGKATFNGDQQEVESERVVRDGKTLTPDELAAERDKAKKQRAKRHEKKGDEDIDWSPFAKKNAPSESFELLRREVLWGRPTYVLKVKAMRNDTSLANGTVWIDAERWVELKGELVPSAMPPHADWLKVQEQYVMGPRDTPVPSLVNIAGAGHFMFMHKQFRSTLRWSSCR
jgi:hypothetical protein